MGNPLLAVPSDSPIPVLLTAQEASPGVWALTVSDAHSTTTSTYEANVNGTSGQLVGETPGRKGLTIYNSSATANIFLTLGPTSSLTAFTVKLVPGAYYEAPYDYMGPVSAIGSATGTVTVTEFE